MIDTHAHLYWDLFKDDFEQVVNRAYSLKINKIINIGTNLKTSQQACQLTSNQIDFYSSIGIHPEEIKNIQKGVSIHRYISSLNRLYQKFNQKIIGIGECGLDYHYSPAPYSWKDLKDKQMQLFISQVNLGKSLKLPVIIHCRDAREDIFIDELEGSTGLFHNLTGSNDDSLKALKLGYYLSFSCNITYPKNEYLRQIILNTPIEKILTETDCPFLPPQIIRGKRNEPIYLKEVIQVIADIKKVSFEEVSLTTFNNAKRLFKIK